MMISASDRASQQQDDGTDKSPDAEPTTMQRKDSPLRVTTHAPTSHFANHSSPASPSSSSSSTKTTSSLILAMKERVARRREEAEARKKVADDEKSDGSSSSASSNDEDKKAEASSRLMGCNGEAHPPAPNVFACEDPDEHDDDDDDKKHLLASVSSVDDLRALLISSLEELAANPERVKGTLKLLQKATKTAKKIVKQQKKLRKGAHADGENSAKKKKQIDAKEPHEDQHKSRAKKDSPAAPKEQKLRRVGADASSEKKPRVKSATLNAPLLAADAAVSEDKDTTVVLVQRHDGNPCVELFGVSAEEHRPDGVPTNKLAQEAPPPPPPPSSALASHPLDREKLLHKSQRASTAKPKKIHTKTEKEEQTPTTATATNEGVSALVDVATCGNEAKVPLDGDVASPKTPAAAGSATIIAAGAAASSGKKKQQKDSKKPEKSAPPAVRTLSSLWASKQLPPPHAVKKTPDDDDVVLIEAPASSPSKLQQPPPRPTTAPKLLFGCFTADRRVVPARLNFWSSRGVEHPRPTEQSGASSPSTFQENQEEASALAVTAAFPRVTLPSLFLSPKEQTQFRTEVVCAMHCAVGYAPAQARPSYFGTHNTSHSILPFPSLLALARFPPGTDIPQSCGTLDYEYDSGDDWDYGGDEHDVDLADSSGDSDDDDSNSSSSDDDDSFINDVASDDSDGNIVNTTLRARRAKLDRIRGKDKLLPSFSGPFDGIPVMQHPLRLLDLMTVMSSPGGGIVGGSSSPQMMGPRRESDPASIHDGVLQQWPLSKDMFARMMQAELAGVGVLTQEQIQLLQLEKERAAALRNKLAMSSEAIAQMHGLLIANPAMREETILHELRVQQLCAGVSKSEVQRTIKRFYLKVKGHWELRPVPWPADDPRLFVKSVAKPSAGSAASLVTTPAAAGAGPSSVEFPTEGDQGTLPSGVESEATAHISASTAVRDQPDGPDDQEGSAAPSNPTLVAKRLREDDEF